MSDFIISTREEFSKMMETLRRVFDSGRTLSLTFRERQLDRLYDMVTENFDDMVLAAHQDLRKSKFEAASYELEVIIAELRTTRKELRNWEKRKWVPVNLMIPFDSGCIKREPYGVALIISAWNYPFLLTLQPLIGAIAGGNVAIIKPSEHSPHVSAKIAELMPKYLDQECYRVVLGDASYSVQLLEEKFDYIFATCSSRIGRSVLESAAKHLTPSTLEMGGKSPVYIDENCNLELTAKRILWGKLINLGQTCVAPDYILCSKEVESAFITFAHKYLEQWYGEDPKFHIDLCRIVNKTQFNRLTKLLEATNGMVIMGGESDPDDLYIPPTIVVDVRPDDALMEEEIFGPILPIVTVNSQEGALRFIKARPKPLALYVFSDSKQTLDFFIENTSSGTVCCNDVVVQIGHPELPFGGVGPSGIGRYHGRYTYEAFTHEKSIFIRDFSRTSELINAIRYPPYTEGRMKMIALGLRHFTKFNLPRSRVLAFLFSFLLGVISTLFIVTKWMVKRKRLE